jgi:hypothetical protein
MGFLKSEEQTYKVFFDTFVYFAKKISQSPYDEEQIHIHCTLFYGASILANNVVTGVTKIKKEWDKGRKEKTFALFEICIQPMISVWFGAVENQFACTEEDKRRNRELVIRNVLYILDSYTEEKLTDFLKLDAQFQYDINKHEEKNKLGEKGVQLCHVTLLMSKLAEAVGFNSYIDWRKQDAPVTTVDEILFMDANKPYGDFGFNPNNELAILTSIQLAGSAMFKYYKELQPHQQ